jgi:orotate phosphoribosyltransferase
MSRKFMMSFKSATEVKQQFDGVHLKQLMDLGALKFGEFKLKSGRVSPYYFSSSFLCSGKGLHEIGRLGKKL